MKTLVEYLEQVETVARRGLLEQQRKLVDTLTALELLAAQGVTVGETDAHYALIYASLISVDKGQLTAIRRALGRLRATDRRLVHSERNVVRVTVRPVDPQFHHLGFDFKIKLARGAKCRIVTRRVTERSLVCES